MATQIKICVKFVFCLWYETRILVALILRFAKFYSQKASYFLK